MIDTNRRNSPTWIRELFWDWAYYAKRARTRKNWKYAIENRQIDARAYWFVKKYPKEAEEIYRIGYRQGQEEHDCGPY